MGKFKTIQEKLWDRTIPEPNTGCILFLGNQNHAGYGRLRIKTDKGFKTVFAHRLAWESSYYKIESSVSVCHTCDTPVCVNPKHLFVGAAMDNFLDMMKKGREGIRWRKFRTHCKNGHEFTTENTKLIVYANGSARVCRICKRISGIKYREKGCKKV